MAITNEQIARLRAACHKSDDAFSDELHVVVGSAAQNAYERGVDDGRASEKHAVLAEREACAGEADKEVLSAIQSGSPEGARFARYAAKHIRART